MKPFDLDGEQSQLLDRSFLVSVPTELHKEKFEKINEKMLNAARFFMSNTKKSAEQTMAIRKLKEAQFWLEEAVKKYE